MLNLIEKEELHRFEVAGGIFVSVCPSLATSVELGRNLAALDPADPERETKAHLITYLRGWEQVGKKDQEIPYSVEYVHALPPGVARKVAQKIEFLGVERHEAELNSAEDLIAYVNARLDYPALVCKNCLEIQKLEGTPPECATCPVPRPTPENSLAWEVYQIINTEFIAVFGGAETVFFILGARMSASEAMLLLQRLIIIHQVVIAREREAHGEQG